jgi:hypothetical protein
VYRPVPVRTEYVLQVTIPDAGWPRLGSELAIDVKVAAPSCGNRDAAAPGPARLY